MSVNAHAMKNDEFQVKSFWHSTRIEDKFSLDDLASIMSSFSQQSADKTDAEEGLTMDQFCSALSSMAARNGITRESLAQLFMKIDTSCDDRVDWDEFCSYMLVTFQEMQGNERAHISNDSLDRESKSPTRKSRGKPPAVVDIKKTKHLQRTHPTSIVTIKVTRQSAITIQSSPIFKVHTAPPHLQPSVDYSEDDSTLNNGYVI